MLFDQMLGGALSGRGAIMLVNAPVGVGKTALLRALTEHATTRGAVCCTVTASADERSHALGLLDQMVTALRAAGMSGLPPESWPRGRSGPRWTEHDFFAALERLFGAIRDFTRERPLVLGVDDVHFADEDSVRCLAYLIRRAGQARLLIVATESATHDRELAALHTEILHLPYCRWVRLTPLTRRGIAEQLSGRLEMAPSRELVAFCAEITGGNPLLLHALIDDLPAGRAEPGDPGAAYRQAVLRSLHRSEPGTAAVARSAAVLGGSATPQLIAELLAVSLPQVWMDLFALRTMGLLADSWPPDSAVIPALPVSFRHNQARSAVLSSIPPTDLPEMHHKAAELMQGSGAPAADVAEQIVAAQNGDKAERWVAVLQEAAADAMAAGDVAGALTWLRHAVGLGADEAQRARAGVLLSDAEWHADPATASRRLAGLGQDARGGLLTGRDTLVLVNQLLWWGEFADADALLRTAPGRDDGQPGAGERSEARPSLARLWAVFCGGVAPEEAAWSGPIVALTYLGSAVTLAVDGAEIRGVDQLLRGIRAGISLTPALFAIVQLVRTGRLDEAVRWSDRLLGEDWIRRVPMRRVMIELTKAVAVLRRSEPAEALRLGRAVFAAVPPATWGVTVGLPLALAVHAATELGDFGTARSFLDLPVPPAMLDTPFAVPYLQALGQYHLAMGYPETALTHFRACAELLVRWQLETAEATDAQSTTQGRNGAATALRSIGMIRPMSGLGDERRLRLPGRPGTAPDRPEPHLSDLHREAGPQPGRARRLRAMGVPRSVESQPAPDVPEPGAVPGDADEGPVAQLTDAERRVAALASAGKTNRQVAEELFITVSTVEQHLTKIYRKLDVQNRSSLAAALRRHRNRHQ